MRLYLIAITSLFLYASSSAQVKLKIIDLKAPILFFDLEMTDKALAEKSFQFWMTNTQSKNTDSCYDAVGYRRYVDNQQEVVIVYKDCKNNTIKHLRYAVFDVGVFNELKDEISKQNGVSKTSETISDGCFVIEYKDALVRFVFRKCYDEKRKINEYFIELQNISTLFDQ